MIFLTVGSELPFDRLVRGVDELLGAMRSDEEVFAQIGRGHYKPVNMPWVESMPKGDYDRRFDACRAVIGHAGMGTIMKCLETRKPLLAMPRRKRLNEIITDHQVGTCRKFEERGDLLAAYEVTELPARMAALKDFTPPVREADARAIVDYISNYLASIETGNGGKG